MNDNVDSMELIRSITADDWQVFRSCHFIRRIFRPYPCLAVYDDESGVTVSQPYRGESFDSKLVTLIENGWDHEHCEIGNITISDGHEYWTNNGPELIDLCLTCYPKLQHEMESTRN